MYVPSCMYLSHILGGFGRRQVAGCTFPPKSTKHVLSLHLDFYEYQIKSSSVQQGALNIWNSPTRKAVDKLTPTAPDRLRNNVNKQLLWN